MSITRKSIRETTGNNRNVAQSFKQNIFFDSNSSYTTPFTFNVPLFTTTGGTKDYYGQSPDAIFTSLINPSINFDFFQNTISFGVGVYITHDIYRIDWELFNKAKNSTITQDELMAEIQNKLENPIYSIIHQTSGMTSNTYHIEVGQFIKKLGDYKTELFKDRDQFIIDTNFIFSIRIASGVSNRQVLPGVPTTISDNTITSGKTSSEEMIIESSDFKGLRFKGGNYFTFFEIPDKPTFEYPTPTGQTNTFTPEIFWSNGESADSYIVQVNYNTGDTSFTGSGVTTYTIPKSADYREVANNKLVDSTSEFSADKTIRKYQISLKSNSCLIYRVGNVKELKNIFDVKQSVVTFSDTNNLCTQSSSIKDFVYTESDSKNSEEISRLVSPPSIDS